MEAAVKRPISPKILKTPNFLFGVNPYIKYDLNWVGLGVGAHVGNIRWVPQSPIDQIKFNEGTRFSPIMPEVYFRVGRRDILDIRYTYWSDFPSPFPVLLHEFSIGSGFSFKTDFSLRLGGAFRIMILLHLFLPKDYSVNNSD